MNEEFKFRPAGTNLLLTFAELDQEMQRQYEKEVNQIDVAFQRQYDFEIKHLERRMIEIFDRRLGRDNDTDSLGKMKCRDVLIKFR
jgi:hypothetical protein